MRRGERRSRRQARSKRNTRAAAFGATPNSDDEALAEVAPAEADVARELVNGHASMTDRQAAPGPRHGIGHRDGSQPSQEHSIHCRKALRPGMSVVETCRELVAHRAADVGEMHDARGQLAAADAKQRAGRTRLQEYVQAVQVSAHTHEGRRLLQAGDEGAVRARRLRTRHARDLDGLRQADDEIDVAGRQAGMLPLRNIAHARAGVVRDERTQRQRRRGDGVVSGLSSGGIVADSSTDANSLSPAGSPCAVNQ